MAIKNLDLHNSPNPGAFEQQELPTLPIRAVTQESMDIAAELLDNYNAALSLRDSLKYRDDVPPNQIAQVMNSMTTILTQITKLQTDLYNSQRIKDIELTLIDTLKTMPREMQEHFFASYEARFKAL